MADPRKVKEKTMKKIVLLLISVFVFVLSSISAQETEEALQQLAVIVEWQSCQIEVINDNTNVRIAPTTSATYDVEQVDAGETFDALGYLLSTDGHYWLVLPNEYTFQTLTGTSVTRVDFQFIRLDTVTVEGECASLSGQFVLFNERYYTCPEDWCVQFSENSNELFQDAISYCFEDIVLENLSCRYVPEVQPCDDSHTLEAYGDITWTVRFWTCDDEVQVVEVESLEEFMWGDSIDFDKCYIGMQNLFCHISDEHNQNRRLHFEGNRPVQLNIAVRGLVPVEEVYFMDASFEEASDWTAEHPEGATPYFNESNICYSGSTIPPQFFTRMVCYEDGIETLNTTNVVDDLELDPFTVPIQWAFINGYMYVDVVIEDEFSDPRESNILWVATTPDEFEECYRADYGSVYVLEDGTMQFFSGYNTSHNCEEIGYAGDFLFGNE